MNQNLHALTEQWFWLVQIQNVELDHFIFGRVAYSEVKPLIMTVCVDVILKHQIIFIIADFDSQIQISTFKPRFKY